MVCDHWIYHENENLTSADDLNERVPKYIQINDFNYKIDIHL
jgi:hypothetical protein